MKKPTLIDHEKIDDIVVGNINHDDYPDFSDASIQSAMYNDPTTGEYRELDEDELATLDSEWVSEQVWDWIH